MKTDVPDVAGGAGDKSKVSGNSIHIQKSRGGFASAFNISYFKIPY